LREQAGARVITSRSFRTWWDPTDQGERELEAVDGDLEVEVPPDPRRPAGKRLTHEDLSQLIIERELGDLIRGLRRAPGSVPERDAFGDGETVDPRWLSFIVSKPALADPTMPTWVRWLQPLLSGVFTVDNLDYVRRDAHMTGVATDVDVERLRRYAFIGLAAQELRVAPRYRVLSRPMLRLAGWFDPLVAESYEMLYQSDSPYLFDSGKFATEFGFAGTPYAEGIRATAASY